ncbi:MAG TPA: DUF72 domain-containing protein [Solirubrobacterales bacterium]|nr:DUF72 domain-containing protein [Solirubrobacterales bacterium]
MKDVRIGCSGWVYASWREGIYKGVPQTRWLERYAELFDTVEVNATFYRLIKLSTVEGWVERTPPGFVFAVKGSRYLTHVKRLQNVREGMARFWEPLEPLRESGKLGPVLWQLPPSFQRDDAVLASTLELLPPARHCFEFRHPSWFVPAVRRLIEEHGASLVIPHDGRRPLPETRPAGELAYLRLHHGERGRNGNYSKTELDQWRRRIAAWRSRREVFAYLNNDWEEFAPPNALALRQGLSVPALV